MTVTAPTPIETTTKSPRGEVVPVTRKAFVPSPLNRRRWQNFKANRRGYWSFWIFMVLFVVSLFAELIANDRPFLIKYDGHLYWPAFVTYSETTFGGDFAVVSIGVGAVSVIRPPAPRNRSADRPTYRPGRRSD